MDYVNGSAELQRNKCKNYYAFEIFKDTFSSLKSAPLLLLKQRQGGKCQGIQNQCFKTEVEEREDGTSAVSV